MRVTLLAPLVAPLRAAQLGGAQSVVCDLAVGLLSAGIDTEVVAARGSRVSGVQLRCAPGGPFPEETLRLGGSAGRGAAEAQLSPKQLPTWLRVAAGLRERGGVIHGHAMDWPAFATTANLGLPVAHTLHLGPVDAAAAAVAGAVARCRPRPWFVVPSQATAAAWRRTLPIDAVIPNGVDPATVPFGNRPHSDRAVVAGRISPEKGTHLAIAAALRAGMRVVVAGAPYDRGYWTDEVAPLVDGDRVRCVGPLPRARLLRLFASAAVVVQASLWEEPFCMIAVEAAMAGTPVAATARGALTEVVDGHTGRLAARPSPASLAVAIVDAARLDRDAVRRSAVRRFALARAVARHLRLYAALSGETGART